MKFVVYRVSIYKVNLQIPFGNLAASAGINKRTGKISLYGPAIHGSIG